MTGDLVILDPGLRQRAGHHYEYDMAIRTAAIEQGWRVSIHGHRAWRDGGDVHAHFNSGGSSGGRLRRFGHAVLGVLPQSLRSVLFDTARRSYRAVAKNSDGGFAQECQTIEFPQNAMVLCTSASYADLASAMPLCAARSDLQWRFILRQLPQSDAEDAAFAAFLKTACPANVVLLTDTQDMVDALRGYGTNAYLIPIPMTVPDFVFGDPAPSQPFTFAMLGPARAEKGIAQLPAVVRALCGTARFVIQTTLVRGQAPEPEVERAIRELRAINHPNVVLIDEEMDDETFYRTICNASCLLIPYDRSRYRARSSGLLVQAYLCGRPAIVPQDTWMADQVPQMLSHTIWRGDLLDVCRIAMDVKTDMKAFTESWRARHNPAATLSAIISAGR